MLLSYIAIATIQMFDNPYLLEILKRGSPSIVNKDAYEKTFIRDRQVYYDTNHKEGWRGIAATNGAGYSEEGMCDLHF